MWTTLLWSALASAGCDDAQNVVDSARRAIVEGRLDDAEKAIGQMETSLGCGPGVNPDLLARFWLAEGAWLGFSGDLDGAGASFRAAHRVRPDYWNPELGPVVKEWYDAAIAVPHGADGTVKVSPAPIRYVVALDGALVTVPVTAPPGLHLVEVGPPEGPMAFGRFFLLDPGQTLSIDTDLAERPVAVAAPEPVLVVAPEPVVPPPEPEPEPRRRHPFAIGAGVAGGLAIASGAAWAGQNSAMRNATSVEDLDRAKSRQILFSSAGYALGAVAASGIVLEVAL